MRTILLHQTQAYMEERAPEMAAPSESEEEEKKEQTELEEWANKVHKEAVHIAASNGGDLKLSGKESIEVQLKRVSDQETEKVQERLRKEQEVHLDVTV